MALVKRLSLLLLALLFVAGTTGMLISGSATSAMPTPCHEATWDIIPPSNAEMPCKGITPACVEVMGCAVLAALLPTPLSPPMPIKWAVVAYHLHSFVLDGRSVEPELFPPILSALSQYRAA
jgi:hypothetical protein